MTALARSISAALALAGATAAASAAPACPARDALGTSRVIAVDPAAGPIHVGLETYPQTLALADHEVVLTFDDGPSPATTPKVLDALAAQCVRATFFLIGRHAAEAPSLVRREIAEGHAVGHHSMSHPAFTLRGFDTRSGEDDIADGIEADERAGYGAEARPADHPHVPFFRFPGFADSPEMLAYLDRHKIAVFGADLWAADWLPMTPDAERARVMGELARAPHHSGIILFHDTKASTAAMLPPLLRDLKAEGYRVVALEPGTGEPGVRATATLLTTPRQGWRSQTEAIIAHLPHRIVPGSHHLAEAAAPRTGRSVATPRP